MLFQQLEPALLEEHGFEQAIGQQQAPVGQGQGQLAGIAPLTLRE